MGSRTPISPVEQTTTSIAPMPSRAATCSAVGVGVLEALGPGAARWRRRS